MNKRLSNKAQIVLVILVIIGAVFVFRALINSKPIPKKRQITFRPPLVETMDLSPQSSTIQLVASGTLEAATESSIPFRVQSIVTWVNPQLRPGGSIKKGEVMAKLDTSDASLSLKIAEEELNRSRLSLEQEKGRSASALIEWELQKVSTDESGRLAKREPQLAQAKSAMISAEAKVAMAKLQLDRCQVKAPYDLIVMEKVSEIGEQVSTGKSLARVISSEKIWLRALLPMSDSKWLAWNQKKGNWGQAILEPSEGIDSLEGSVIEKEPIVDSSGRMMKLLVEFNLDSKTDRLPPLGSFVKAFITGKTISPVYVIPRSAWRRGEELWLLEEGMVSIKNVTPIFSGPNEIFIASKDLPENPILISSRLGKVSNGLKVRTADQPRSEDRRDPSKDSQRSTEKVTE